MSKAVQPEALFEIERVLAEPTCRGVPIGSTLGPDFVYWLNGTLDCGWIAAWLARLRYPYHRLFPSACGVRPGDPAISLEKGRLLFTLIDLRPDSADLIIPVLRTYGPEKCHVLGNVPAMKEHLPLGVGFLPLSQILCFDAGEWRREFARAAPTWRRQLRVVFDKHNLPRGAFPVLMHKLLVHSLCIMGLDHLLDILQPVGVVTEYDRYDWAACLVLAAKARGIPTMTMMHGVINPPYGYTPLLADVAFCWGELQRDQMVALGTDPRRLAITGFQRMTREPSAEPRSARAKVALDTEKPVVLLATAPILHEARKCLVEAFCQAFVGQTGFSAVVRLHPSEEISFYAEEIARFPSIKFLGNSAWTKDEALAAADIVIVQDSGFGDDALVKRRLVVVLGVPQTPLKHGKVLAEQAGCPVARTPEALRNIVAGLLTNPIVANRLRQQAEEYVSYSYAAFGAEAVTRVCRAVRARIEKGGAVCNESDQQSMPVQELDLNAQ